MTYVNKGSTGPTVTVTLTPDLSGNFVCSGAADQVEINAAIDFVAALGAGGEVHLGPGTYVLAATISMDQDDIKLVGSGWDTYLNGDAAADHAITVAADNCVIRDLQTSTTQGGTNNYDGINVNSNFDFTKIINVFVNGSDRRCIGIGGSSNHTLIEKCYLFDADEEGIFCGGGFTQILGTVIEQAAGFGIEVATGGDDSVMDGNVIDTTGDDGINIHTDAENCIVDSNRITSWTNECIDDDSGTSTIGDNECT